jgi:hypothetical protein
MIMPTGIMKKAPEDELTVYPRLIPAHLLRDPLLRPAGLQEQQRIGLVPSASDGSSCGMPSRLQPGLRWCVLSNRGRLWGMEPAEPVPASQCKSHDQP